MFIWERPDWPEFRYDIGALTPALAAAHQLHGELLGRSRGLSAPMEQGISLQTLCNEVVKSSAIEGIVLPPDQVRISLERHLGIELSGVRHVDLDIDGIVQMTVDAVQCNREPLTSDRLFGWHSALFPSGRSGIHQITVGTWRLPEHDPMQIVSGAAGREKVHYEAPGALRVPQEMNMFLDWFENSKMDPILKAGLAHFWFVKIHPFADGNGRMVRAITEMALARHEPADAVRAYSVAEQLLLNRPEYYAKLETAGNGDMDVTAWLSWFTTTFQNAVAAGHIALDKVIFKAEAWKKLASLELNPRQQAMMNRLFDGFTGHMTAKKWAILTKCSHDTASRDIQGLIEHGALVKGPAGSKNTHYLLTADLQQEPEAAREEEGRERD